MATRAIRATILALTLLVAGTPASANPTAAETGTVRGCVEISGNTHYRGVASLWPAGEGKGPDPRRAIRPPLISGPLGTDGCFTLKAKPGEYFVGAIVRLTDGGWQGPPRVGDTVFLSPDASDKNIIVTIRPDESVDIGCHAAGWKYSGFTLTDSPLTIAGKLTTPEGKPLPGLLVFAFTDSTMSIEPLAVSEPSDRDGHYLLRLPEPATVYLRAREHYGKRSPMAGGYMGVYGGGTPVPVIVDTGGNRQDLNLTVFYIPPPDSRSKGMTELHPGQKKN